MDILTLNSKVNIACKICDKCCEYRGDIKITSINVCMISKFLGISTSEFINNYTHDVEGEFPEIAINGIGEKRICVFNDRSTNKCTIHKVRPMQCAMFPLVPENLNQDFFINSGDCVYDNQKKMKIKKFLGGKHGIYMRYKDFYIKWITLMEEIQFKSSYLTSEAKDYIKNLLYLNYDTSKNIRKQVEKNFDKATKYVINNFKIENIEK